jgi:uncharacterized protein
MRRLPLLLLMVALLLAGVAHGQALGLYEGETTVASQGEGDRVAALPRALARVLVKVTGDTAAAVDPALIGELRNASQMVRQYRYRQDVSTVDGVPQMRLTLIARFDDAAVNELIARGGRTLWPSPRPQPLVWLAIDDGRGARLVGEAQAGAVGALSGRAAERGLKLQFPLADAEDQRALPASAVWAQQAESIRAASRRYGSAPMLVGRLQRSDSAWSANWLLLDHGSELKRWSATDPEAAAVLAAGADGLVSALSRDYAERIMSGPAGDYRIRVLGLTGSDDYARVVQYLKGLPIVRNVRPAVAEGDTLQIDLALSAGVDGLSRLVEGGGVLVPEPATDATAVFRLEP